MESITNFLDPKSIPDVTGDDLDVDKELDKKSDLDTDSDTIEVNITNNIEKDAATKAKAEKPQTKISDIALPDTKESSDEESSESETSSEESSSEESESSSEEPAEEPAETSAESEPEKEESSVAEPTGEAVTETDEVDLDTENAVEKEEEPSEDAEKETEKEEQSETDAEAEPTEESNPEVDHGESDLDVDTQASPPLLKLVGESDFHNTKIYELPNGAQVVYIHNPSDLCICSFDYKVGSYYEDDSNRGISHLIEHLMFNGCPGISALEFNEKLDKLGMSVNAFTTHEMTSYYFSGLKANFISAFDLYANLLNSFTPTQEIVDKERGVVLNEIGVYNDDNWSVLTETINAQAYRQHPIANPILGYADVIRNISVDQVKNYYTENYNSKNLTVYLVGDFPEEDLVFVASKLQLFADGNKNSNPVITDAMVMPSYKNINSHKEGATQTLIKSQLVFKNEAYNIYELNILSEILGGTMSSYLWNEFREERSIAYKVGATLMSLDPEHTAIVLYAGLNDAEDAQTAKSVFHDAFMYAKAVTEDDFGKGLNISLADLLSDEETGMGLLNIVRDSIYYGLDVDSYVTNQKNLTYDSYQAFSQQIEPDNMVTGILYPLNA